MKRQIPTTSFIFSIIALLGAFFLLIAATFSLSPVTGVSSSQSIIIPYIYNMDIYLVRGDGTQAQRFLRATFLRESKNSFNAIVSEYDAYLSVHINQKQTNLVAVKAVQKRRGGVLEDTSQYHLVVIDLTTRDEKTLLIAQEGESVRCPQWSPDGTQIAFWKGSPQDQRSGIFLLATETTSLSNIQNVKTFFDYCEDMGTYLRWINSKRLAVYSSREGLWLVDTQRTTSELVYDGRDLFISPYYSLTSKDFSKKISSLPKDVITSLWGDSSNPRAAPYWSPDGRFFFYHVMREGLWARRWIERYDPQTGESSFVKTVWWRLYQE